MPEKCPRAFEERLLSGYLDGELTQADEQRVRIHAEDCPVCRRQLDELQALREVMMTTRVRKPDDASWDERPHGRLSLISRVAGWWIAVLWAVVVGGWALLQAWRGAPDLWERLLVFGGLSAVVLLFVSVLVDRLRGLGSDRYREVRK